MKKPVILILDVGKSNSKISLVDSALGNIVSTSRCKNSSYQVQGYKALNIEGIWQWFLQQTTILAKQYSIKQIIVTTHGAAAALVDENELLLPIVDYEFDGYQAINEEYDVLRSEFSETGSLKLPSGLNLGRQLYWLQNQFPISWQQVKYILMLPQFFNWKLTGVAVSELTSLGCHTDLWCYTEHCYSSLVTQCNWQNLFPEMAGCGEELCSISAEIASQTGLSTDTIVLNGVHDSNASLVPYLQSKTQPLNVISSGTWTVICALGGGKPSIDENNEMMVSMSYQGKVVPSVRFMGGREWQLLQVEEGINHTMDDIQQLMKLGCYPLPSFTHAGPFATSKGIIVGEDLLTDSQRSAVGTLYLALMSRYCLDLLDNSGDIIIEGSFIDNLEYLQLLQGLSKGEQVFISKDASGTTLGAARLSKDAVNWSKVPLTKIEAAALKNIHKYYENWRARLQR